MITENVSTLKIHKLTQAQYNRELANGTIDENALYLTPDEEIDLSIYATKDELDNVREEVAGKSNTYHTHTEYAPVSHTHTLSEIGAAPMYTYGTQDIEAGSVSTAPTGTLHFVYE